MSTDDPLESMHKQVVESKRKWISEAAKIPEELPPNKYIFCNQCEGETNHTCKADYCRHYLTDTERFLGGLTYTIGYRLWMCAGCESCTLERYYTDESLEDEDGIAEYKTDFFPKRTEYNHKSKRFRQLPTKLDLIYRETVQVFNNQVVMLCGVGIPECVNDLRRLF